MGVGSVLLLLPDWFFSSSFSYCTSFYNACWQFPRAGNSPSAHHEHQGGYFQINGLEQNTSIVIEEGLVDGKGTESNNQVRTLQ